MSNNYSEQIFQSIDTIISQRLNEVSFDKTEICEVISQDENNKQKYWVTNGSLKFEAYSIDENRNYTKENQKVYVTIPQGNYDLRKIIIGSYSADETNENLYVNPFDHFVVNSKYKLINKNNYLIAEARKDGKVCQSQPLITNDLIFYPSGLEDFNYIGIDFSATTGFGGTNGEFQIIIDLCGRKEKPNGGYEYFSLLSEEELGLLTFSSKQLYGNPYYLNDTLSFQHLFNFPVGSFSDVTKIKQIKVTLVTKGNFNYNGDQIQNVIINNLTLYLGFKTSSEKLEADKLIISNINNTTNTYSFDDLSEKEIRLEWYNNQDKIVYNDNQPYIELEKYQIYWCKYIFGYEKTENDIWQSGSYWKVVQSGDAAQASSYLYSLNPNTDLASEQIKVILIEKTNDENWLVSNGLTYENLKPDTVTSIQNELEDLLLTVPTGLIYNIYGENNQLLSNNQENKQVSVEYLDNTIWDSSKQKVIWKIPKVSTLLSPPQDQKDLWEEDEKGEFYTRTFERQETNIEDYGKTINFIFKNGYDYNYINNTIRCDIIRYDGDTPTYSHFGTTTLQFGLAGTSGSQFNLNIYPTNGKYFIETESGYELKAMLTGPDGKEVPGVDYNLLTWSWYSQREVESYQYSFNSDAPKGQTVTITRPGHKADVYAIVQATYEHKIQDQRNNKKFNTIKLIAYFPIATNSDYDTNYVLQGATRIVYDFQGTSPQYNKVPYKIYDKTTGKEVEKAKNWKWQLWTEDDENETIVDYYYPFSLTEDNILMPPTLFPSKPPKVSVMARNPDIIITDENGNKIEKIEYIQPILVIKNNYSSSLINEWDGTLQINDKNNTIFSSLIGAGVKNREDNTFTGVLMGAVGDTIKNAKTGLYGFQNGTERFSFTEKGSAYIGTGSDNFISFNEGNSRSESGELKIQTKSFVLNTKELTIDSTVFGETPVIKFSDKFELRANGTATIGGWNIGKNNLSYDNNTLYFGTGNNTSLAGKFGNVVNPSVALKLGNNFGVTSEGKLYAKEVNIQGTINAEDGHFKGDISGASGTFTGNISTEGNISVSGTLNVTGTGTIAGWTIQTNYLQSVVGNVGNIKINSSQSDSNNWIEITQTNNFDDAIFKITKKGVLHATGAVIKGDITGSSFGDNNTKLTLGTDSEGVKIAISDFLGYISLKKLSYTDGRTSGQIRLNVVHSTGQSIHFSMNRDMTGNIEMESVYDTEHAVKINNIYCQYRAYAHQDNTSGYNQYWICFGDIAKKTPPRIKGQGSNLYLHAAGGGSIYAGGEGSDDKIATQGGSPSTLNLKTDLVNLNKEYDNLYQDLQKINMYNYSYQYDNLNKDNMAQYGFIIDEIENTNFLSQYFKHYNKYGKITGHDLVNATSDNYDIEYKIWDRDSYIKGQFILIKTLQYKIDQLEKEIKEIKQNEI